jgi:hypothetical protein
MAPLTSLKLWSPFKIDALGIVTLLGADAIRKSIGRLVYSQFEYFLLLAGHIFADNSVAEPVPGFILYNITEGIMATGLSAWFKRWLLCQNLTYCSTELDIRATGHPTAPLWTEYLTILAAIALNAFLVLWPILITDRYGLAASLSLVSLVLVRVWTLWACRQNLDSNVRRAGGPTKQKKVKLFLTPPNGASVVVKTTTGITQDCLLTNARPQSKKWHQRARAICWLAFSVHVVSLDMASFAVQIPLVVFTLLFSVLVDSQAGCNESRIGSRLVISRYKYEGVGSRAQIYMLLDLTEDEEQCFLEWSMFPKRVNKVWWNAFEKLVVDTKVDRRELFTWGEHMRLAHAESAENTVMGE